MRDPDDATPAEATRPLALGPAELVGVLETAARLKLGRPGRLRDHAGAASAAAAELARAAGIDDATLSQAQADRRLRGALTGLTLADRRWFLLKRLVAGLPGSLLPKASQADNPLARRVRAHLLAARAGEARKDGSWRLAIWLAHRALAQDPACYKAWFELGRTLEKLQRLEEACDAYRMAVEVGLADDEVENPGSLSSAINNLGVLIEGAVDLEVAEALYLKALEVRPTNGIAAYNLALLYKTHGRFEEAQAWFERAVTLRPDDQDAARELGIVKAARQGG